MNLFDSSFLCLDIGTHGVRGIAQRIRNGRLDNSAIYTTNSFDTTFAIKSVVDELERQIGARFESAYITGNFGESRFRVKTEIKNWQSEHKITQADIKSMLAKISTPGATFPMHIIPLRYKTPLSAHLAYPIGHTDTQLQASFAGIFYNCDNLNKVVQSLQRAHIQAISFFDPQYLQYTALHNTKQKIMLIDLGDDFTSASLWTRQGPVYHQKIGIGGRKITEDISAKLNISFYEAERIKRAVSSTLPKEMDRFTPADSAYDFSRSDINDILLPYIVEITNQIKHQSADIRSKYIPDKIVLTGGGSEIENIDNFIENLFNLPVENMHSDATINALSKFIWESESAHRNAYLERQEKLENLSARISKIFQRKKKPQTRFIPIMPSTLCFDMHNPATYSLFQSGGISMIHVDIMDGFYVDAIAGSIEELKEIRSRTKSHLHVHLMTENPNVWATDAIAAGADTIILSTGTAGLKKAIKIIKTASRRVGIALNPENPISMLEPILADIDEVMVMGVSPGAAGQKFNPDTIQKIYNLSNLRKKNKYKFIISTDGGITDLTAQNCWNAGAGLLVSGSYLSNSSDFPLAVQSLLKKTV